VHLFFAVFRWKSVISSPPGTVATFCFSIRFGKRTYVINTEQIRNAMIVPISIYSDEILHRKALPLDGIDAEIEELVGNMFETMYNAPGIGLAAPQVGRSLQLLVVDISCMKEYAGVKPMVVINPRIIASGGGYLAMEEGCLSLPGVQGDVVRPATLHLQYRDEHFEERTGEFSGMFARVLQHEIDHLHGRLFVDRLKKREMRRARKDLDALLSGRFIASYPVASVTAAAAQA
jgi:peptide deformylase